MPKIDEQIQDAMRKGQFDNLPGAGKPLKLDNDAHTPEHLRMAHKLLKDNDLAPDWMTQGQEIDAAREHLIVSIRRAAREHQGALNDADRTGGDRAPLEQRWRAAVESLRAAAKKHNSQVLSYNLKVPQGVTHKRHFDFEAELGKYK
ncbi:MAG TPA: DUF1992 domain-containing protein [Phototrophicaceae bacterium]|nr:DUF1992 domain-containing protein [Phototrophicaceae bacterium]